MLPLSDFLLTPRSIHPHRFSQNIWFLTLENKDVSPAFTAEAGAGTSLWGSPGAWLKGLSPPRQFYYPQAIQRKTLPEAAGICMLGQDALNQHWGFMRFSKNPRCCGLRTRWKSSFLSFSPHLSYPHQSWKDFVGGVVNSFPLKLAFPFVLGLLWH